MAGHILIDFCKPAGAGLPRVSACPEITEPASSPRLDLHNMLEFVSDALLASLFSEGSHRGGHADVTQPVSISPRVEVCGIESNSTRYLVLFLDAAQLACDDEQFMRETAAAWGRGVVPEPHSRVIKFYRADADEATMFDPKSWPLPHPRMIWKFCDALGVALTLHARSRPEVPQYFYFPQSSKLDTLYRRLARKFERGELGVEFHCVTHPPKDEGGFYGFERVEQDPRRHRCTKAAQYEDYSQAHRGGYRERQSEGQGC
jgi:hypothetical protein